MKRTLFSVFSLIRTKIILVLFKLREYEFMKGYMNFRVSVTIQCITFLQVTFLQNYPPGNHSDQDSAKLLQQTRLNMTFFI